VILAVTFAASLFLGEREALRVLRHRETPVATQDSKASVESRHVNLVNWVGIATLVVTLAGVVVEILRFWH
jgi:hypothetical protein